MVLLLACTTPAHLPTPTTEGDSASPAAESRPATYTAAEVEERLGVLLAWELPTPAVVERAYFEGLALGDDSCPGDAFQLLETNVPADGCVTQEGTFFEGQSQWYVETNGGVDALSIVADFSIQATDGREMRFGGLTDISVEGDAVDASVTGTWAWTEDEAWLAEGVGTAFTLVGERSGALVLNGGVGGLTSDDHLTFESLSLSSDCPAEGVLRVRDPAGDWYSLVLDCDSCGELSWYDGSPLGEVCVDVDGMRSALDPGLDPETWGP